MKMRYYLYKILLPLGIFLVVPVSMLFAILWITNGMSMNTGEDFSSILALFSFSLGWTLAFSSEQVFGSYLRYFPLNNFKEFDVSFEKEEDVLKYGDFVDDKGTFAIKVKETEEGIWTVFGKEKNLRLDLYSLSHPKEYIAGFFVRNFNYVDYNKTNHAYKTLYKKRKISWLNKINDIKIIYDADGEKTEEYIVKNKEAKIRFLIYRIMFSTLNRNGWMVLCFEQEHHEASERQFRNYGNEYVFRQEKRPPYWFDPMPNCYPYSDVFDENGNPLYPDNDARLSHPKYAKKTKKKK